ATFQNAKPVIGALSDVEQSKSKQSLAVALSVSDGDNDSTSLSASVVGDATASITGSTLTLTRSATKPGQVTVTVSASDGAETASRSFTVTYTDYAPTLSPIPDTSVHWTTNAISIDLQATDPDGDELTYQAHAGDFPGVIAVGSNQLTITPSESNYVGSAIVTVSVSDGTSTDTKQFTASFTNSTPLLPNFENLVLSKSQPSVQVSVAATDADGDTLSYRVSVTEGASASISGTTLTLVPAENYVGTVDVTVTATDNAAETSGTFSVGFINHPPKLSAIPLQSSHFAPLEVQVAASDEDQDELTLTAQAADFPGTVSVDGTTVRLAPSDQTYVGTTLVTLSVTDGSETVSTSFEARFTNVEPQLPQPADVVLPKNQHSFTLPLGATDADGDVLVFQATIVSPADSGTSVAVTEGTLTTTLPEQYLGVLTVRVSATDGAASVARQFTVTRVNHAPVIDASADLSSHWRAGSITTPLTVTDADEGDTVTVELEATSAGAPFAGSVSHENGTLTLAAPQNFVGDVSILITADDTLEQAHHTLLVHITNTAPTIGNLPPAQVSQSAPSLVVPLSVSDADSDPLEISARLATDGVTG
ncbi:MAG: tandem-95 repeat protein, partial [Bdellovibrionales bacterium]|nr:tandem-95 repeat protein [Bdellovibrionales bacterium]